MVLVWVINIFILSIPSKIYIKPVPEVYNGRKKLTKTQHWPDIYLDKSNWFIFSKYYKHNNWRNYKVIKITQGFKLKLLIRELLKLLKNEPSQVACDAGLRGGGSWERRGRAISGLQDTADTQTWKPQKDPFTAAALPRFALKGYSFYPTCALRFSRKLLPYRDDAGNTETESREDWGPPPTATGSHFWISCHEMHQLPRLEVLEGLQPWKSQACLKMSRLLRPPETKLSLVLDGTVGIPKTTHQQTTASSDSHGFASWTLRDSAIRTARRAPKSLRPPQGTPPRSPLP